MREPSLPPDRSQVEITAEEKGKGNKKKKGNGSGRRTAESDDDMDGSAGAWGHCLAYPPAQGTIAPRSTDR